MLIHVKNKTSSTTRAQDLMEVAGYCQLSVPNI